MFEQAPNGYFLNDLIVFDGLRKGGYVSKGFIFEPPDLSTAASAHLNDFQDQLSLLLASLHEQPALASAMVLRFRLPRGVAALPRGDGKRDECLDAPLPQRALRALLAGDGRTQATPSTARPLHLAEHRNVADALQSAGGPARNTTSACLSSCGRSSSTSTRCCSAFSRQGARIMPMKDADHYRHYTTFLNPSLADRFDYDPLETSTRNFPFRKIAGTARATARPISASSWTAIITRLIVLTRWPKLDVSRNHPSAHQSAAARLHDHREC